MASTMTWPSEVSKRWCHATTGGEKRPQTAVGMSGFSWRKGEKDDDEQNGTCMKKERTKERCKK